MSHEPCLGYLCFLRARGEKARARAKGGPPPSSAAFSFSRLPFRAPRVATGVLVFVRVNGSHLIKNYLITFLALISGRPALS